MRIVRAAALASAGLLSAWLLAGWAATLVTRGPARVDEVVALAASAAGALLAAWYGLAAVVLVLAELAGLSRRTLGLAAELRRAVERLGPPVFRRAAAVGVGAGFALGAAPASAGPVWPPPTAWSGVAAVAPAPAAPTKDEDVPLDLRPGASSLTREPPVADGSPTSPAQPPEGDPGEEEVAEPPSPAPGPTDTTTAAATDAEAPAPEVVAHQPAPQAQDPGAATPPAGAASPPAARSTGAPGHSATQEAPAAATQHASYVVRRGDSLWAIAAAHLGAHATDAEIATAWPRWYQTNRAVVGADPDLIHPGQELLAPDPKETP